MNEEQKEIRTGDSMREINAGFSEMERIIKRETIWLPVFTSVAWAGCLGILLWQAFTGEGWSVAGHCIILAFAIFQVWTFWDVDARRRVANLKYETAAGLLDHFVAEEGWEWGDSEKPGSVSLKAPDKSEAVNADTETEK